MLFGGMKHVGRDNHMEKKVVKTISILISFCTLVVCMTLWYMPRIHAQEISSQEQTEEKPVELDAQNSKNKADLIPQENVSDSFPQQLRIQLPDGDSQNNITISNKYITQTIDITIPGADENYLYEYPMIGKCNNIDNLTFESQDNTGVLEITMDKVFELSTTYKDNYLYIDFLSPHQVYKKVVVIDAGHGGNMPGAFIHGSYEKDIDLAIALQLKALFDANQDKSIGVYFTRTDDSNPSFEERVGLANKTNADLFISIHNNSTMSGKMSSINGTTVMYDEEKQDQEHGTKQLAQICVDQMSGILGSRNRGVVAGHDIYIIRNSISPVALIEVGFMTNQNELKELNSLDYQKKAAQGIFNSIEEAFKEGF